ncbi:MAG: N-acetyl-gamma-glutamyl-phosphate reductase, partial [Oscillospiraceae bacterium]
MHPYKIFIDGSAGTTGLRIRQRLLAQPDITLLELAPARRKELPARLAAISEADLSVLCLPDDAAKEIAALAPAGSRLCDASTAHRTNPGWVYGLPELTGSRSKIKASSRVAVPGCHATGFTVLAAPLVQSGALPAQSQLCCHSLTGYSGGGTQMIAAYETHPPAEYQSPREYGLALHH